MKPMTTREKFSLIQSALGEGVVDLQVKAGAAGSRVAQLDPRAKNALVLGIASLYLLVSTNVALAASKGCSSPATTKLVGFIDSAAKFMMALGGAGALLMFAVGAFFIIAGGTGSRVSKGFGMLKNAVIGLVVLAAGFFIQEVVLSFVSGATGDNTPGCINKGSKGVQ